MFRTCLNHLSAIKAEHSWLVPATACAAVGAASWLLFFRKRSPKLINAQYDLVRPVVGTEEMYSVIWNSGLRPIHVGFVVSLTGNVTVDLLENALRRIQLQQPTWRYGIQKRGSEIWFHEFRNPEALITVSHVRVDAKYTLHQQVEDTLNAEIPFSPETLLWWADLVTEAPDRHHIIIWQQHCITDGAALMQLAGDLVRELQNASDLAPMPAKALPGHKCGIGSFVHQSPAWKAIPLWKRIIPRALVGYIELNHLSHAVKTPVEVGAVQDKRITRYICKTLDSGEIERFRAICKEHKVTVSAAVIAAVVRAVAAHTGVSDGATLAAHTPISIRDRLNNAKVSSKEYLVAICAIDLEVPINAAESLWDTAQRIYANYLDPKKFDDIIAKGELFMESISGLMRVAGSHVKKSIQAGPDQRGKMSVSCFGCYQGEEYPLATRNFKIENFELTIPLGSVGPFPLTMCWTYSGKFVFCFTYQEPLMSRKTAEQIVEASLQQIRSPQ